MRLYCAPTEGLTIQNGTCTAIGHTGATTSTYRWESGSLIIDLSSSFSSCGDVNITSWAVHYHGECDFFLQVWENIGPGHGGIKFKLLGQNRLTPPTSNNNPPGASQTLNVPQNDQIFVPAGSTAYLAIRSHLSLTVCYSMKASRTNTITSHLLRLPYEIDLTVGAVLVINTPGSSSNPLSFSATLAMSSKRVKTHFGLHWLLIYSIKQ